MSQRKINVKRLLCLSLATLLWHLSPISFAAEIGLSGDVRVRGFYTNNLSDANGSSSDVCRGPDGTPDRSCDDQESFSDIRFRVKMTAKKGIASGVSVIDLFSNEGRDVSTLSTSATGTAETGNYRFGTGGYGGELTTIVLREAYLRTAFPWFSLQFGRQEVYLGHGLILADTADGIVIVIPAGPVGVTFGSLKLIESDSDLSSDIDTDVYFANTTWTPTPSLIAGLFFLTLQDRGPGLVFNGVCEDLTGNPPAYQSCSVNELGDDRMRLFVGGLTLDTTLKRIRFGFEVDVLVGSILTDSTTTFNDSGKDIDLSGYNSLIEIVVMWPLVEVGLTGIYASGQDTDDLPGDLNINSISANYVLGNILVNNETISYRDGGDVGGLTAVELSFKRPIWDDLEGELAVIWAKMTEKPAPGINRELGWELDFNTTYPFDTNLVWNNGLGVLFSGEAWEGIYGDPGADDLQVKFRF